VKQSLGRVISFGQDHSRANQCLLFRRN